MVTAHVLSTLQCLVRPSPQRRGRLLEVGRNNPVELCTASMWSPPLGWRKDKVTHTHKRTFLHSTCILCVFWIIEARGVLLNSLIYFQHLHYLSHFSIHSKLQLLVLSIFYIHKSFSTHCLSKVKLLWRGELEMATNTELTHAMCRVFENYPFISFLIPLQNCTMTNRGPCISEHDQPDHLVCPKWIHLILSSMWLIHFVTLIKVTFLSKMYFLEHLNYH